MSDEEMVRMLECVDRARIFYDDVMPQIGKIVIQDHFNTNELGVLLHDIKKDMEKYIQK